VRREWKGREGKGMEGKGRKGKGREQREQRRNDKQMKQYIYMEMKMKTDKKVREQNKVQTEQNTTTIASS
jgi:hypothetical protein